VIRKHYNRAVEILDGGRGYDALKEMKERLEDHQNRAKEAANGYESRRNYAQLQFAVVKKKVISIAQERVGEDDGAVTQEEANQILDEPMGAYWKTEDGKVVMDGGLDSIWVVMATGFNPDERWEEEIPLSDINIDIRPENGQYEGKFDEDDLHSTDRRLFDGDETWRDVLDSIKRRWEHVKEQHERAVNTKELLRFRLGVIETVLYRFEAYGSVEEMSDTEAQSVVNRDLPDLFSGRPTLRNHAERLVKKYRQRSTSLPDGMEAFKEWVPDGEDATGRSIVARLQSAYREEEISDRYDDPESFCDLVSRLLEKHFDERSETF
jgi:hypothetical protein